ncbi:unnamed protein product [Clonostachys rhizophaga]|uniref:NAD(P)-binding domain-containing protein n=1 Tax=Clonostachys rhizophaga TaxID=160324 RepID=A0A9N9V1T3_9HYPO|nr:unnamed protein product [Clonostachys rhizophaga]
MSSKQTVAIAGSGNIAQYLTEEFLTDGTYHVTIISRTDREFFHKPGVTFHVVKEYSTATIVPILDGYDTTALISTLQGADPEWYTSVHEILLASCVESKKCKRFISSEYQGNLRHQPNLPRGNHRARQAFRAKLAAQKEIQATLVLQGWLADYWVQPADESKSYIRPFPNGWPIDLDQKTVRIPGTGDEPIGWTATRDMAKAVVKLISYDGDWPDHTYVFGELGTWNEAIPKLEKFLGRKLERNYRPKEDIDAALAQTEDFDRWYTATMDEWNVLGGTAVPRDEALKLRETVFKDVHFRDIEEVLADSKRTQVL